jgi:predicted signal transduction protein with EAL and GGDEF domain
MQDGAATLAARLVQAIAEPYEIDGHPVVIGCSIGVAVVPEHGTRIDEVLRNADLALYKSKNAGRNCFHLYSTELKDEADQRDILEIELREAIWREEIDVFYQPIFDLSTGRATSVEALARWRHKTRGLIPPAEFIPIAEEGGLIGELGNLVLAKACRHAVMLPDDIKVAVNLSALQFAGGNLVDSVMDALAESGLAETRLELEITESVFLADSQENLKTLERLKRLGVSIALDDFGVGYSSLSYLTAFPFNKVKIDKSFIEGLGQGGDCDAIVRAVTDLCRQLGMTTTAEGVETRAQLDLLSAGSCTEVQGYFFSRPRPASEVPELCRILGPPMPGTATVAETVPETAAE